MIYEGDVLISQFDGESFDINFENGQTTMTKFFENITYLLVFGRRSWYNKTVSTENQKMKSTFPDVIERATVSDNTLARATQAIKSALQPLLDYQIASIIDVNGEIISLNGMAWEIKIQRANGNNYNYSIQWDNGVINATA